MDGRQTHSDDKDEECHDQEGAEDACDHACEAENLHLVTAAQSENETVSSEEKYCLCDDNLKHQLDQLEMRETETYARLEEVEHRLLLSENKLRSCTEMLELIGLLRNRIELVHRAELLPGDNIPPGVPAGLGPSPGSPVRSPNSPIRSPKSPIRSPKSPRSI